MLKTITKLMAAGFYAALILCSSQAMAGAKLEIDETKWISVGMGARASFANKENASRSEDLNLDGARIYINGQIHKYVKFEINTECVFCSNTALRDFEILDVVAKFEFNPMFNIWAGRLLVPADRAEASGPFFANTYDFNKTPFYPTDFSITHGLGGAGVYNRDHGATLWGSVKEGRLQYAFGVFDGLESNSTSGPNQDDNLLFASRIAYNFLNVEKNPGYYGSSTYFGNAGDIFTIGLAAQHHDDGVGTITNPGDFFGMSVDVLFEKVLTNNGVFTVEAEYKNFNSDFNTAAYTDGGACFCMFDGDAWTATALYLFPEKIIWGQFQPYVRYTENKPDASADRDEFEVGLNYIINGHNARIAAFYQVGDIETKGLNYAPTATGDDVGVFKAALQVQF